MPLIRPELPSDHASIRRIHESCFPTAAEARLVDALRAAGRLRISLVACVGPQIGEVGQTEVVGHAGFSPVHAADGSEGLGLAPVAVLESHRRRGIAASLIRAGIAACADAGCGWAVVLGEPAYYGRFGFVVASQFGLRDEYSGGAAFQAIELIAGRLPRNAGLIRYAPEFAAVDFR